MQYSDLLLVIANRDKEQLNAHFNSESSIFGFWPLIVKTKNANLFFSISWHIQDNITIVFITKNILLNKDILLSLLKCALNCSLSLLAKTNKRWLYCNGHFYVVKLGGHLEYFKIPMVPARFLSDYVFVHHPLSESTKKTLNLVNNGCRSNLYKT